MSLRPLGQWQACNDLRGSNEDGGLILASCRARQVALQFASFATRRPFFALRWSDVGVSLELSNSPLTIREGDDSPAQQGNLTPFSGRILHMASVMTVVIPFYSPLRTPSPTDQAPTRAQVRNIAAAYCRRHEGLAADSGTGGCFDVLEVAQRGDVRGKRLESHDPQHCEKKSLLFSKHEACGLRPRLMSGDICDNSDK